MGHWLPAPGVLALGMAALGSQSQLVERDDWDGNGGEGTVPSPPAEGAAFLLQGGADSPQCPHALAGNFPLMSVRWCWRAIINRDNTFPGQCVCPRLHCWKQAARLRPNLFHPSRHLVFSAAKTKQRWEEVALLRPQRTGLPQHCCNFTEYGQCSLLSRLMTCLPGYGRPSLNAPHVHRLQE